MVSIDPTRAPIGDGASQKSNKFYVAAWRWHFYTGIFVVPFFAILAISGLAMLWIAWIDGRDGERTQNVETKNCIFNSLDLIRRQFRGINVGWEVCVG